MADTLTLTITLSPETCAFIRERVESGEFADESDYVSRSVDAMKDDAEAVGCLMDAAREGDFDKWLTDVGGPTYDRMKADPSRGIPIQDVFKHLDERRRLRKKGA